jgi:hydroxymethylglutaryl-CoA lyase
MEISESLAGIEKISELARLNGTHVVAAVGLALFCPYEGEIPAARTMQIIGRCVDVGITEAYLATSAGADGPRKVYDRCLEVRDRFPDLALGMHLHDTNGMALANALAALQAGVTTFESSICGLGGGIRLPEGRDDYGNVATEDLVNLFTECGVRTGMNVGEVVDCAGRIANLLDIPLQTRAGSGGTKQRITALAQKSHRRKSDGIAGT